MTDSYCIYNGHLVSLYEPSITFNNRAFRYGDALFETIRFCNNQIMFLADHISRLKLSMTILRMNLPAEFTNDNFYNLIMHLIKNNAHAPNARIRLTVFRNNGGHYTPHTNDISFLIESEAIQGVYELNQKGIWADIFADIKKPINKLSNIKSGNALIYVMAGISKKSMNLDECFLINENGTVCESISSNIFVVKNGALFTPKLIDGCVDGVMRKQIIKLASENKILSFENPITMYTLSSADEVFLTNSINGIQWVGQFKDKFYTNKMAHFFIDKLINLSQ